MRIKPCHDPFTDTDVYIEIKTAGVQQVRPVLTQVSWSGPADPGSLSGWIIAAASPRGGGQL